MVKRNRGPRKSARWVLIGALILLFFSLTAAAGLGLHFYSQIRKDLPDVAELKDYRPSLMTTVYADSGEVIGKFFIEKRVLLELRDIPDLMVKAFIAIEDARFYAHHGVDVQGISRAFWANFRAKQIMQGGSTITQQLAKTLFLSPERTVRRKIKEMILALEIEQRFSKEEILELYLNQIYFGQGAYGVEAAAETYFGKHVGDLSLAETALLAGLPKSPNGFNPFKDPERARIRRSVVLARMHGEHFITAEQKEEANQDPFSLAEDEKCRDASAYFVEHVRRYLINRYGSQQLYRSGLEVHTTLNLEWQHEATEALRAGLREYDKRHGYRGPLEKVSVEEPQEGSDEGLEEAPEEALPLDAENRGKPFCVNDILDGTVVDFDAEGAWVKVQGLRGFMPFEQMKWAKKAVPVKGSADPDAINWVEPKKPEDVVAVGDLIMVKVIEYDPETEEKPPVFSLEQEPLVQGALIALDPVTGEIRAMVGGYDFETSEFNRSVQAKRQPGSAFKPIIYGAAVEKGFAPSTILIDTPIIFKDPNMDEKWKPANYSERFYGPTRLRTALAKSRNVVTVKLLQKIGIGSVIDFAERIGITSPLDRDFSLALGSSGLTLLELTSAYSVFANHGHRAEPIFIRQILDYDGNVVEETLPASEAVIAPEVAYTVSSMLEDVVKQGTGQRMRALGRPSAGKTGTTNNFLDALYIGFVPDLVTGVWVGFDDMRTLGKSESGAKAASPIWLSFMKEATRDLDILPFSPPSEIMFVKVDEETGLLPSGGSGATYFECYRRGNEPREYAPVKHTTGDDFFDMDSTSLRSLKEGPHPVDPRSGQL